MKNLDPAIRMLAMLLVFFTLVLFYAEHFFHGDGQLFQVVSNLLSGVAGALLMGIRRELGLPDIPMAPGSTQDTATHAEGPKA